MRFTTGSETDNVPTIDADETAEPWNGFAVPIVTADALRQYIADWRRVDPNGDWSAMTVTERLWPASLAVLIVTRPDGDEDVWTEQRTGRLDGDPLYALDGWTWVEVPACPECGISNAVETVSTSRDPRVTHYRCTYCRWSD